jgi:hypothetical protein
LSTLGFGLKTRREILRPFVELVQAFVVGFLSSGWRPATRDQWGDEVRRSFGTLRICASLRPFDKAAAADSVQAGGS